jgi:regulatory protein
MVSRVERVPRKGEYLITLSNGAELRILKEHLSAAGIEEGASISRERIAELDTAYRYARARQAAMRLLKVRPRTELELRRRLGGLRTARVTIDRVIDDLRHEGHVDDRIFARLWVKEKRQRGDCGKMRIRRDLEAKGIDRDVVADELSGAFSDAEEAELARALARKKMERLGDIPAEEGKRKVYSYLLRRGFASDAAGEAARHAVETSGRTDEHEI